jgi:hypothetical protein
MSITVAGPSLAELESRPCVSPSMKPAERSRPSSSDTASTG